MKQRLPLILLILCGLLLPLALPMAPASADDTILTSLISYWELDEESGTRYDAHGSNDLTDNNTVGYASGVVGNAALFTAANSEHLSIANNPTLQVGDIDFTLCAWVWISDTGTARDIISQREGSIEYYIRTETDNRIRFYIRYGDNSNSTSIYTAAISQSAWHYFVAWHDSVNDTVNIQLDNSAPVTSAHSYGVNSGINSFRIAYPVSNAYWDGLIDQVGFWKRVLATDERTWLYNSGAGRSYAELVAAAATPTPTPTSTPTPTGIPAGTPAAYNVIMPSGQTGTMYATVSAGEGFAIVLLVAIVLLLGYQAVSAAAEKWKEK